MYRKILVPIDGSRTSMRGLDEAIGLAKSHGARLRLVNVIEEYSVIQGVGMGGMAFDVENLIDALRADGKKIVTKAMARIRKAGVKADSVTYESFTNRSSDFIVEEANKWRADLIVMGTHGRRGVSRMVLGSDAEIVVRTSPVPVLLVRSPEPTAQAMQNKST
jgi:nucleotide-binding universal stress UspA family protein